MIPRLVAESRLDGRRRFDLAGAATVTVGLSTLVYALVKRLGADCVSGADPSQAFVDACRARLPGVEVVRAGAEQLPFGDGTFEVVLSQLVVNFMVDPLRGAREMARVARPGGIVGSCVWDYAGGMTLLRASWDAAREIAPDAAATSDEGTVMRWCGEGELAELWHAAGLRDVRFQPLIVRARYTNFEDLWSPLPHGVAPSGAFCKALTDHDRAALHDAYRRRLGVGDQPFELTARAWSVTGRAP